MGDMLDGKTQEGVSISETVTFFKQWHHCSAQSKSTVDHTLNCNIWKRFRSEGIHIQSVRYVFLEGVMLYNLLLTMCQHTVLLSKSRLTARSTFNTHKSCSLIVSPVLIHTQTWTYTPILQGSPIILKCIFIIPRGRILLTLVTQALCSILMDIYE